MNVDRHNFIEKAFELGANACVINCEFAANFSKSDERIFYIVDDVDKIADEIVATFYDKPLNQMTSFAVTGTDGKTSTATIIARLLGIDKTAYVGTNGIEYNNHRYDSWNTTPSSFELYPKLKRFYDDGASNVALEFSSEAMHYNRLRDAHFDVIGITNITSEHLNTHGTIDNYLNAKADIFRHHLKNGGFAVLNENDDNYAIFREKIMNNDKGHSKCVDNSKIKTYGFSEKCDLFIENYTILLNKTTISFRYRFQDVTKNLDVADDYSTSISFSVDSPLLGEFNIENLACAFLMIICNYENQFHLTFQSQTQQLPSKQYSQKLLCQYKHDLSQKIKQLTDNLSNLSISGRMENVDCGQDFKVIVDYAHTPNGLTQLYKFVKLAKQNGALKRIITVIGQAGERDAVKRPTVGKIVADNSDYIVWTEEDRKNEDPINTINDILSGLSEQQKAAKNELWVIKPERNDAIIHAVNEAQADDLILILGKGAEDFQKIGDKKIPWSDILSVKSAIKSRLLSEQSRR